MDFTKQREQAVQISYRQKLLGTQAEYILRSTIAWKKPIEIANYELIMPKAIKLVKSQIAFDHFTDTGKEIVYYWEKRDFMPSENMIFLFTEH